MKLRFYTCLLVLCVIAVPSGRAQYWTRDVTFDPVLESAIPPTFGTPILVAPDNKVIVATPPYAINGVHPPTPARLNADGSVDPTFTPPQGSTLHPLAVYADGRVLVAQQGVGPLGADSRLIRLNVDGTPDASFASPIVETGTALTAQILSDSRLLLAGRFQKVGGVARNHLAVLEVDGAVSGAFHSPFAQPLSFADLSSLVARPAADGKFLIVGPFTGLGPQGVTRVARLMSDGTVDPGFSPSGIGFPQPLRAHGLADGRVVVIGAPAPHAPSPYWSISRLQANGALDATFAPQLVGQPAQFGELQSDGKIVYLSLEADTYVARRIDVIAGTVDSSFAVTIPSTGSVALSLPQRSDTGAYFFASPLTLARQASRFGITRASANGVIDDSFNPRFSSEGSVDAYVRQPDGKWIIAGTFDHVNGQPTPAPSSLVRFTASGSIDPTFAPVLTEGERITELHLQPGGKVIAFGYNALSSEAGSYNRFNSDGTRDATFHFPGGHGTFTAFDGAANIYRFETSTNSGLVLRRYTPNGDVDPGFSAVPLDSPYHFAVWPSGEVVVTVWDDADEISTATLQRYRADGAIAPEFTVNPELLPGTITGLVALPDGRLLVIGTVRSIDVDVTVYLRFDRNGSLDYQFYGTPLSSTGGAFSDVHALEAAGVIHDALRASGASAGTQLHVDLSLNISTLSIDLVLDGPLAVRTAWNRPGLPDFYTRVPSDGPTVDPRPTVLSVHRFGPGPLSLGGRATLSTVGGGLYPLTYQWFYAGTAIPGATSATLIINPVTAASAGNYTVELSNAHGTTVSAPLAVEVNTSPVSPAIAQQPESRVVMSTGDAEIFVWATGNPLPVFEWKLDGVALSDPSELKHNTGTYATSSLFLSPETSRTGIYTAVAANASRSIVSAPTVVGRLTSTKVTGAAREIGPDILHPSGRTFDQILLEGTAASITADSGQVTRMSFVDMNDDIVQVEFSGAGTVSLTLAGAPGPAAPASHYVQPGVNYMKGHASIVVAGANETSHLSVFTVGRANAVDQSLFRDDVTYDGVADLGYIAILSANGEFGGLRCANVSFFASKGLTGVYAPSVEFTGPVYVGDIDAFDDAEPVLILGSATGDTQINGGDLAQTNARAVRVDGLTQLKFVAGTTSHGTALPAQANQARLERDGVDVTAQIVIGP